MWILKCACKVFMVHERVDIVADLGPLEKSKLMRTQTRVRIVLT